MATNYGGRHENCGRPVKPLRNGVQAGELQPEETLTEDLFSRHLSHTADIVDPDLLIRTSGECALVTFCSGSWPYAEIYVTDVLWARF